VSSLVTLVTLLVPLYVSDGRAENVFVVGHHILRVACHDSASSTVSWITSPEISRLDL
jgi:hypothetical protein